MSTRRSLSSWVLIVVSLVVLGVWLWVGSDTSPTRTASESPSAPASRSATPSSDASPSADPVRDPESGLDWVDMAELPPEAAETLALIDAGGPFPYSEDDETFGNFEGILPNQPRGYYREYTVDTPGLSHRGARRIVVGRGGEFYWTADHYESFQRIRR